MYPGEDSMYSSSAPGVCTNYRGCHSLDARESDSERRVLKFPVAAPSGRDDQQISSISTLRGLVAHLTFRQPFVFITWFSAAVFGLIYALTDDLVLFNSGIDNTTGVTLPTLVLISGPEPMKGPPQVAYILTVVGGSSIFQTNLSGIAVTGILAALFGINVSLIMFLQRRTQGTVRPFGSLLAIVPSILSTSGCCGAPLYLLLLGDVAAGSVGFALLPYFGIFVYASFAMIVFNIYYFGKRAIGTADSCRNCTRGEKLRTYVSESRTRSLRHEPGVSHFFLRDPYGLGDIAQAAASLGVGDFAPAVTSLHFCADSGQDVGATSPLDFPAYRLYRVIEAVAGGDGRVVLLLPDFGSEITLPEGGTFMGVEIYDVA